MKKGSKAKEYAKQHSNSEEEYKLLLDAYISGWDAAEEILNINSIENIKSQSEEILRIIREHTSTEFINKKAEDDFFMSVLANLVAKKIEKILGL